MEDTQVAPLMVEENEAESNDEALYGRDQSIDGSDEGESSVEGGTQRVSVQPADISIFEYKRRFDQGRLKLDPDWQRSYVWSGKRPSLFIESILMGLPIPVLFFAVTGEGRYEVIDGVQRLTTCFRFLESKFKLSGLTVFPELNGKSFRDLSDDLQGRVEDSTIACFQVSSAVSQDMLFTIFERINSGGVRLNEMEIRNCIFRGALNDKIKVLAQNPDFLHSVNMRGISDRMLDRALILRFLAFYYNNYQNVQGGLKRFLNGFLEDNRNPSANRLMEFEDKFKNAMRACVTVFGKEAFRVKRDSRGGGGYWAPRVNASIFQVVSTSLARVPMPVLVQASDAIFEEYVDMMSDRNFIDSVTKATGDTANIRYSFETWNDRLKTLLNKDYTKKEPRAFSRSLKEEGVYPPCIRRTNCVYDGA